MSTKNRTTPPSILIIFGASGDLTSRKLIPAVYNLALDSLISEQFCLFGFGRQTITDEEFRNRTLSDVQKFSRRPLEEELWGKLGKNIFFHTGNYDDVNAYHGLYGRIKELEKQYNQSFQLLFYVSTPPSVFQPILENLGTSGMASHNANSPDLFSKVIVEKPFGKNLETAQNLNKIITQQFSENQIYRIDHYLGKETVQNLLVQRFANTIFEPLWNFHYVECVQISVAESLGVGTRAGYYDQSGALRDMIQNHTMQLVSLVAMEPPGSLRPQDIRDEKVKLVKAIQPLNLGNSHNDAIRAQYTEGSIDGQYVKGYMQEENIKNTSTTETYSAIRLSINNWRWQGVPFYIRSGKRLAKRVSEIVIQFKNTPGNLFNASNKFDVVPNLMVIRIQPDEGATLLINSKIPGIETKTQPVKMYFKYSSNFGSNTPEAYERLILDALNGDNTLFIRGDETEASWKLFTPLLDYWHSIGTKELHTYPAGSWGPAAADILLAQKNHSWHQTQA